MKTNFYFAKSSYRYEVFEIQSESDFMPALASPSDFAVLITFQYRACPTFGTKRVK